MFEKPIIFDKKSDVPDGSELVDSVESSLEELFIVRNPQSKGADDVSSQIEEFVQSYSDDTVYVYFPWNNVCVHMLNEDDYFELRTARNRNLINQQEQTAYRELSVGVAGLSVGSAILSALVVSGGPKSIKIADFDVIEVTNLNRIRATLSDFGKNKTHIAAQNIWDLDPFASIDLYEDGINEDNAESFLMDPKLDVFIDEMDSLPMKVKLRQIAREKGIPVLMATDNGDGFILDIERFDLNQDLELFHGNVPEIEETELASLDFSGWVEIATKIVDPGLHSKRMKDSINSLGSDIASIPQLGTSAAMAGSATAYMIRQIANGSSISGRFNFSLDELAVSK